MAMVLWPTHFSPLPPPSLPANLPGSPLARADQQEGREGGGGHGGGGSIFVIFEDFFSKWRPPDENSTASCLYKDSKKVRPQAEGLAARCLHLH